MTINKSSSAKEKLLLLDSATSFADVAHQRLIFDANKPRGQVILDLIDTRWVQRLRHIKQTGNTNLVYMFAEHSRFGHSLGVAYLADILMSRLSQHNQEAIDEYALAVVAAAVLHDIGHVAPGSHLAERVWGQTAKGKHEAVSIRAIKEDEEIGQILDFYHPSLRENVVKILACDSSLPPWTVSIISGGGWNADRGNWALVDSAMCAVSYGRYNVLALIDAFRLSSEGELVIQESRLDALTHFFVARDSMYRQVYQHRVLQAVDELTINLIKRIRYLIKGASSNEASLAILGKTNIHCDTSMLAVLTSDNYAKELPLETIAEMTESWWNYHVQRWCQADDSIVSDIAIRLRDRVLLKTVRLTAGEDDFVEHVRSVARDRGFDPDYYVIEIGSKDMHREVREIPPNVLLDDGTICPVTEIEPMIASVIERPPIKRSWLAVPETVKDSLGRVR